MKVLHQVHLQWLNPQIHTTDLQPAIQPGLTLSQIVAVASQERQNQLQSVSVSEETHIIYLWQQPCERSTSKENLTW